MKHKQLITGITVSIAMMMLILDGKTAVESAREGVALCMQTVIPSLFPFFVLSILQTNALTGISLPFLHPFGNLCGIPKGAESILISGYLGGYPVGAQCIHSAYRSGTLRKDEAERMLSFCSNAGPAFLFGMIHAVFPDLRFVWVLWGIHITSSILVSLSIPCKARRSMQSYKAKSLTLPDALKQAVVIMATVCGWVILFRVIASFLTHWILWYFPAAFQTSLIGFLELSNGCCDLHRIPDISLRFVICSCMLSLGGICVFMQTLSVTQGLSPRPYIAGKLMQTLYSFLISTGIAYHIEQLTIPLLFLLPMLLRKIQKISSIHAPIGV